jgi:hypothetical protein
MTQALSTPWAGPRHQHPLAPTGPGKGLASGEAGSPTAELAG